MAYKSKEEQKRFEKEWYQRNRDKKRKAVNERRKAILDWFNEYKSSIKCSRCSESEPCCIDFHHIYGEKEFSISNMVRNGNSIDNIIKEIKKCIPLCSNCHRKEHLKKRL